jgi:hypothetical protein
VAEPPEERLADDPLATARGAPRGADPRRVGRALPALVERQAGHHVAPRAEAVEQEAAVPGVAARATRPQVDEPAAGVAGQHRRAGERAGEQRELARVLPVVVVEPGHDVPARLGQREVALARHARPVRAAHDAHALGRVLDRRLRRAVYDDELALGVVLLGEVPQQPRHERRPVLVTHRALTSGVTARPRRRCHR